MGNDVSLRQCANAPIPPYPPASAQRLRRTPCADALICADGASARIGASAREPGTAGPGVRSLRSTRCNKVSWVLLARGSMRVGRARKASRVWMIHTMNRTIIGD